MVKTFIFQVISVLLFLFVAVWFFRPIETGDIWWHLATGRWIVEHRQVPRVDIFAFSSPPVSGISPQWLGSLLYYGVYAGAGLWGLKFFRVFLFGLALWMFWRYARKKLPFVMLVGLTLLLTAAMSLRVFLRPFVFNFIFIQIFLWVLLTYRRTLNTKWLLTLPLVGMVWFNMHLGSVVYGLLLIGIFWLEAAVRWGDAVLGKTCGRHRNEPAVSAVTPLRDLTVLLFAYVASFLFNPYGWQGFVYPWKVFVLPDFINFYRLQSIIAELQPPTFVFSFPGGTWFALLCLGSFVAMWKNPRDRWLSLILFLFALFIFLRGMRGCVFFTLVCVTIITEAARERDLQRRWTNWRAARVLDFAGGAGIGVILLIGLRLAAGQTIYQENQLRSQLTLTHAPDNPGKAVEFLRNHDVSGRVFNASGYGGYLAWDGYPSLHAFVDNRQYNQELYWAYRLIVRDPSRYWEEAENVFDFQVAMLNSQHRVCHKLITYLNQRRDWQLVYLDGALLLFMKANAVTGSADILSLEQRLAAVPLSRVYRDWLRSGPDDAAPSLWQPGLFIHPTFIAPLEEGLNLFALGFYGEGMERLGQAMPLLSPERQQGVRGNVVNMWQTFSPGSPRREPPR